MRGIRNKLILTVSHVIDAQAVQWYAGFRDVKCLRRCGDVHGLQKVDMRCKYL